MATLNYTKKQRNEVDRLQLVAQRWKHRDSNDSEIEALGDALAEALSLIGGEWKTLSEAEIEKLENA